MKSLLSSPLDALQALLKGPRDAQQQHQTTEAGFSSPKTDTKISLPLSTEIFDGYSYFNRQEEKAAPKSVESAPTSTTGKKPLLDHNQRQSITTKASTTASSRPSRLAAFADMLGMNEPPAPAISQHQALPTSQAPVPHNAAFLNTSTGGVMAPSQKLVEVDVALLLSGCGYSFPLIFFSLV